MRLVAAVAALLSLLLAGCGPGRGGTEVRTGAAATVPPRPVSPPSTGTGRPLARVLTLGDSGMVDASTAIEAVFEAAGDAEVERRAIPGFGLTRAYTPGGEQAWRTEWPELVDRLRPELVVVHLGGWDLDWISVHGPEAYRALVQEAATVLAADGATVLWVGMLPDDDPREQVVDEAVASLNAWLPGQAYSVDVDGVLRAADGSYPQSYIGVDGAPVRLRKPDGWHLCQDGAIRVALVVDLWARAVAGASDPPDGWQRGPWWDDVAFDSPGCWPPGAWATTEP